MNWLGKLIEENLVLTVILAAAFTIIGGWYVEKRRRANERGEAMFREANRHDNDDDPEARQA